MTAWKPLRRFFDPRIAKLNNLRRAAEHGIRVPASWWLRAAELDRAAPVTLPAGLPHMPWIIRSGSPSEDTFETSNAGQLLSLVVPDHRRLGPSLAAVIDALPHDEQGHPLGCAFIQPLVAAEQAGVAFFDGFYFERSWAAGSNEALTSGTARGEVERGQLMRDDAWSTWLSSVYAVFADDGGAIDIEFARDQHGYILLQSRPALFALQHNPTLSLANHKEILGDPPRPWIKSVLLRAGTEVLAFFAEVDPTIAQWHDHYALELAERAWMNFSFFFRLMDHWGLPRNWVTTGAGGQAGGPADDKLLPARFVRKVPRLIRLQLLSLRAVWTIGRKLAALDKQIEAAADLPALFEANVAAMALAIRTNFAINSVLTGVQRVRRALGIVGEAKLVTQQMMSEYRALFALSAAEREAGLDAWLVRYGHRGPLESDPSRPRFAELRDKLLSDIEMGSAAAAVPQVVPDASAGQAQTDAAPSHDAPSHDDGGSGSWAPFYWIDVRREWFRDELMKRWQRLRQRLLDQGRELVSSGQLDRVEDIFLLQGEDLEQPELRALATRGAERYQHARTLTLPNTASRDELQRQLENAVREQAQAAGKRVFFGISLHSEVIEGVALRAEDLISLLGNAALTPNTILIVAALEPSWAVVFPRVAGVVAEIGGELSHASILLREARKPAIVNCHGSYAGIQSGQRLRMDGANGVVELL